MGRVVHRTLVENTSARGRRHVGGAQKRYSARRRHQSAVSESVSALCVRCVDARQYPHLPFERYADDAIVHCRTEREAEEVRSAVGQRLQECRLELHPEKTKIVYCKDEDRRGNYPNHKFDFLGYTFRPRKSKNRWGKLFVNFSPESRPAPRKQSVTRFAVGGCSHVATSRLKICLGCSTRFFEAGSIITGGTTARLSICRYFNSTKR